MIYEKHHELNFRNDSKKAKVLETLFAILKNGEAMNVKSEKLVQFKTCLKYNIKFFIREKTGQKRSKIFFELGIMLLINIITGVWISISILQDCNLFLFSQKLIFTHVLVLAWLIISSFSMHLFIVDNQKHKRFFAVLPVNWIVRSLSYFCVSLFIFLFPIIVLSLTISIFFVVSFGFITGLTTFFSLLITGIYGIFISGILFLFFKFLFKQNIFFLIVAVSESIGFFMIKFLLTYGVNNAHSFDEKFVFIPGINHIWLLYENMNSKLLFLQPLFFISFTSIVIIYSFILNVYLMQKPKITMSYNIKVKKTAFSNLCMNKIIHNLYKNILRNDVICKKNLYVQISKILTFPVLILLLSFKTGINSKFDINQYTLMFLFFVAGLSEIVISGYYSENPNANWIVKIFNTDDNFYNLKQIYYKLRLKIVLFILIPMSVFISIILFGFNIDTIFMILVISVSFFIFYFTIIQIFSNRVPFTRNESDIITDGNSVSMKAWIFIPIIYVGFKKTFQNYFSMIVFSAIICLFAIFQYRRAYFKLKDNTNKGDIK